MNLSTTPPPTDSGRNVCSFQPRPFGASATCLAAAQGLGLGRWGALTSWVPTSASGGCWDRGQQGAAETSNQAVGGSPQVNDLESNFILLLEVQCLEFMHGLVP